MKYHKPPFILKELKIELTYRCPLACIHCSSDATSSNNIEISPDKCFEIINEAINMGVEEIAFSGGEPLVWRHIEDAIDLAASGNIKVILYTSGLGKNNIEKSLENLRNKGLDTIIFSLYGADAINHEQITRINGSFNKTINAIKNSKKIGLNTEIHFVALATNYKVLKDIAEMGKQNGVSNISVLRFVPQGRGYLLKSALLNKLQNLELKKIINELRREGYNIRTGSPFNFLLLNDQPKCCSAIDRLIIGPDLRIFPCDAFKQIISEEIVETNEFSSLEKSTLNECWKKSLYLNTIRNYLTTEFAEPCKSCKYFENCLSGCLAQKFIYHGNVEKSPDPMCLLIKNEKA